MKKFEQMDTDSQFLIMLVILLFVCATGGVTFALLISGQWEDLGKSSTLTTPFVILLIVYGKKFLKENTS